MIRIKKSTNIPAVLAGKGKEKTLAFRAAYNANPNAYALPYHKTNNPFKFEFEGAIYGHRDVKTQLKAEQFNKCCFCENKDFDDIAHGDVEHFRPKSAYAKSETDSKLQRPGYYWLVYDWSNLFFCCQICNQSFKKNFFPLSDETRRAINHKSKPEPLKSTLLLNPTREDPEKHIGFRSEIPYHKTEKGRCSIRYFGIDREKLNQKRSRHLAEVKKNIVLASIDLATVSPEIKEAIKQVLAADSDDVLALIIQTAKDYVNNAAKSQEAFSLMVRSNFTKLPR